MNSNSLDAPLRMFEILLRNGHIARVTGHSVALAEGGALVVQQTVEGVQFVKRIFGASVWGRFEAEVPSAEYVAELRKVNAALQAAAYAEATRQTTSAGGPQFDLAV